MIKYLLISVFSIAIASAVATAETTQLHQVWDPVDAALNQALGGH